MRAHHNFPLESLGLTRRAGVDITRSARRITVVTFDIRRRQRKLLPKRGHQVQCKHGMEIIRKQPTKPNRDQIGT